MKKQTTAKILAACLTAAIVLTGCSSGNEEASSAGSPASSASKSSPASKTKVTFWTWEPTDAQYADIKAAFDKEYPDVDIEWWRTSQKDDYLKKLQVAMAGGEGPDLFGLSPGALVDQYGRFCEPMDQLAEKDISGWKDAINQDAVKQCISSDNIQVGMPVITVGQEFMLYNKTLLDEIGITKIPATYADMVADAKTIRAKGLVPFTFGAKDTWHDVDLFMSLSQQFGPKKVYDAESGSIKWTDQTFVDTMSAWKKLFTDKVFEDGALGITTYPDARDQYFYARKSPFFFTGSWHMSIVIPNDETKDTKVEKDQFGMTLIPQIGPNPSASVTGVDFILCVNKDSQVKDAAAKFVKHMVMGQGQQIWINTLQGSPVNKNIKFTNDSVVKYPLAKTTIEYVNQKNQESIGNRNITNADVNDALGVALQDVASGKDIAKALGEVQAAQDKNK